MTQTDDAPPAPAKPQKGLFAFLGRSASWLFSQKHFQIKLLSGTVAGVIVIIFLAGVFLFVTYRNHHQEALRTHTIEVMRLSSVLENDIAALETGHRGFLLTGDRTHVEAFERRREAIKERVNALADRIVENSQQRKRVMKVQEIVHTWLTSGGRAGDDRPPVERHRRSVRRRTGRGARQLDARSGT